MIGDENRERNHRKNSNSRILDRNNIHTHINNTDYKNMVMKISEKLNINYSYLSALENGEYNKLPSGVYGKNFLREYVLFLGLDYNQLSKNFNDEIKICKSKEYSKNLFSKQVAKKHYFLSMPAIIKNIIIIVVAIVFFLYLGSSLKSVISRPELFVYSPAENFVTEGRTVVVVGKTEQEAIVLVNNEQILINEIGEFSKTINLKEGVNIVSIKASKKYGRDNIIIRQILAE